MDAPATWWQLPGAAPLHATRRTLDRPTDGPRVALVAHALGTPLLPWQRYTADLATERTGAPWCPACQLDQVTGASTLEDPSAFGHTCPYAYQVVVVTVPRQSGKTTLMRAIGTDRCLAMPDTGVFYTAQTGKDARERWYDLVKAVKESPLRHLATVRSAAGSERVVWPNGSMFRCFAPLPKSLHGYTPPLVMLDEAFAHDELLGNDLMGAIGPAQITIPHRQLWIVSTAGTAESVFLRRWVEAGRAGEPGVAILEWAAGPDVADIYDPAAWPTFHPAMVDVDGRQLVTADALRMEANRLPRSEFERAYGNRWTRTSSNIIGAEAWDALRQDDQRPPTHLPPSEVVYAWDVMPDRSQADLVALWRPGPGKPVQARVVKSAPGMAWLADTVADLYGQGYRTFAYATDGPARELADELPAMPSARLVPVQGAEYADAWGQLLEAIARRQLRHDGSDVLAIHASNVATRPMVDRAAPSRRNSAGPVSAIIALMVGMWVLDHRPPPSPALDYRFAG